MCVCIYIYILEQNAVRLRANKRERGDVFCTGAGKEEWVRRGHRGGSGRSPPPPSAEIPHPALQRCAEEGRPPPPRGRRGSNCHSAPNETPNPGIPVRLSEPSCFPVLNRPPPFTLPPPPPQNEAQMLKSAPGQSGFFSGKGIYFPSF